MATFPLELVTPERLLFSEEVQAVRAPGIDGSFGVLAGHAPLLTELTTGLIKIKRVDDTEAYIATSGGFMQVSKEKVIILADTAELSEEIDVEKEQAAAARARQLLEVGDASVDAEDLRQQIEWAQNRVKIAQIHLTNR
jgi:F-type H+-transporting ATPase subunit epsilon